MPQSSLMTWLNQPQHAKEPTSSSPTDEAQPEQLPTPPPPSQPQSATLQPDTTPAPALGASALRPLPDNVELRACTREDIAPLKRLTSLLLPIAYPDKFYRDIVEDPLINNITLLAVWHDRPRASGKRTGRLVGACQCRLLAHPHGEPPARNDDRPMLYLAALALLSPYRSHGIASHMLHVLTKRAVETYRVSSVGAHVWEANVDGLAWYQNRGFRQVGREPGYYRRLHPQGAIVVQREVSVMDLMGG